VRVKTAKVVSANYELLAHDFPAVQAILEAHPGNLPAGHAAIDQWILDNAGYIARTQAMNVSGGQLHTEIDYEAPSYPAPKAARPDGYRRGLIFDTGEGILDGKGFGSDDPGLSERMNRHGLATLEDCIRERDMTEIIQRIGDAHGGKIKMARSYAVIDWGFDMKMPDGTLVPAGGYLRQAHLRTQWNFNGNLPAEQALEVELLLRQYGLTSAGVSAPLRAQPKTRYDLINIQGRVIHHPDGAYELELVDVGAITRVPKGHVFDKTLAVRYNQSAVEVRAGLAGLVREGVPKPVLEVDDPRFIHTPNYESVVPVAQFAAPASDQLFPEYDRLSGAARAAVEDYRKALAAGKPLSEARGVFDRLQDVVMESVDLDARVSCIEREVGAVK
jgi:hypothetical protein